MSTPLTQKTVDSLVPDGTDRFIWDADVRGLGVRVKRSGVATYVIQYRNSDGRTRRLALGKTTALTLKAARREARTRLGAVASGSDPSAERKQERKATTIEALGDHFLNVYGKARGHSKRYRRDCAATLKHVIYPRWGTMKVKATTRDDVRRLKIDMIGTPTSANRCLALLSKMSNLAIEQRERLDNPCKGIERNTQCVDLLGDARRLEHPALCNEILTTIGGGLGIAPPPACISVEATEEEMHALAEWLAP